VSHHTFDGGRARGHPTVAQVTWRENLDREQYAAVTHPSGIILVLAPAGSGKTRVATRRASFLIAQREAEPESILPITLTKKARIEMVGRLRWLCGDEAAGRIPVGTFHATCARILRAHARLIGRTSHFSIYDKDDSKRVLTRTLTQRERARIDLDTLRKEISLSKNHDISLEEYEAYARDGKSLIVARAWREYEEELRLADALDFDDLVLRSVDLLRTYDGIRDAYRETWKHVIVDEFQDTNPVGARFLRLIAGEELFAVGDDKQVIFGFRLADVRLILEFDKEYPDASILTLTRNYRNSRHILKASNSLIANNEAQLPMTVVPGKKNQDGPIPSYHASPDEVEEAKWIAAEIQSYIEQGYKEKEIAVLVRRENILRRVEHALAAAGIPYQLVGPKGYFDHKEVRTALAHLRLLSNPRNEEAFRRALGIRPKVGEKTIARIAAYAGRHRITLLEAALAVDVISNTRSDQAQAVRQFALDMLALKRRAATASVSEITYEVIRMPCGIAESLIDQDDGEQQFTRLEALCEAAKAYERQAEKPSLANWLQEALLAGRDDLEAEEGRSRVTLATIHSVKGLEWRVVFAAGFEGRVIPSVRARTKRAVEEERRVAYVLLTRCIEVLIFSYAMNREGRLSGPSPFIAEALEYLAALALAGVAA
jgi:DNA helicase-2/ATP-dependent DNA helicase PcrA